MITFYFDENLRTLIQSPGNQAPANPQTWVYFDNYNCQVYIVSGGLYQPISPTDTITAILYQPQPNLPEQQLANIGAPQTLTDANGNQYFSLNVNLATQNLANLVQATNKPAVCNFHFLFTPADLERFSQSQDISVTVNPDPLKDATGVTPVPPAYPSDPSVFERILNKGHPSGYAALDATGKVPSAQLPPANQGDMLKSVYDTNGNGIVDTCDALPLAKVTGAGTAAAYNIPAAGSNASTSQVVFGTDTRLGDARTPAVHGPTHLTTDAIPDVTLASHGLCVPPDGTTVQISGGKLVATTTGTGDMLRSVYDTGNLTNANAVDNARTILTHQIPASGNAAGAQIVLASDTRLSDPRIPTSHQASHNGGTDAIPLASTSGQGLCPPVDGTTVQVSGGKLSAVTATSTTLGVTRPDNSSLTINTGILSVPSATNLAAGIVKPDNTTVTISGGIISAVQGGIGQHGARYRNSASIAAIGAGASFVLTFDTSVFDTDTYYSAGKFTVPAGQGGYYSIGACVNWNTVANITFEMLAIRLNGGTTFPAMQQSVPLTAPGIGSVYAVQNVSAIYHLNAADYIEFVVMFGVSSGTPTQTIMAYGGNPSAWLLRVS